MKYEYISMDTIEENNKLISENEKLKDGIKRLSNRLEDKFMSNYPLVVENGIIVKKNEEIAELLETIDMITNDASEYVKRIDKAIEYIEKREFFEVGIIDEPFNVAFDFKDNILNILRGEDDE